MGWNTNGKHLWIVILSSSLLVFLGCGKTSNSRYHGEDLDSIVLRTRYMSYACGDCFPQYRVVEVISSESGLDPYNVVFDTVDIQVLFPEDIDEDSMLGVTCGAICGDFKMSGRIDTVGLIDTLYLVDVVTSLRDSCCDGMPGY